jgi:hypothetical protein
MNGQVKLMAVPFYQILGYGRKRRSAVLWETPSVTYEHTMSQTLAWMRVVRIVERTR